MSWTGERVKIQLPICVRMRGSGSRCSMQPVMPNCGPCPELHGTYICLTNDQTTSNPAWQNFKSNHACLPPLDPILRAPDACGMDNIVWKRTRNSLTSSSQFPNGMQTHCKLQTDCIATRRLRSLKCSDSVGLLGHEQQSLTTFPIYCTNSRYECHLGDPQRPLFLVGCRPALRTTAQRRCVVTKRVSAGGTDSQAQVGKRTRLLETRIAHNSAVGN